MTPQTTPHLTLQQQLKQTLGNTNVITPGDDRYDKARTLFVAGFDKRPAVIARPADARQVSQVVAIARGSGLPLAVRGGGHSFAGQGGVDDGIVLDLTNLTSIEIDPDTQVVRAQTGLSVAEFNAAAGQHGLATGFGDSGSVGIGGITLGGGMGLLSRKYGLTIDNLQEADVVLADGRIVKTDSENRPDLFWAIRGGGGNFGVVTQLTLRVHDLPSVVGGMLILPATADAIETCVAASAKAPEELSAIINVMTAPPMPFLPAEVHGTPIIMALICYAGSDEDGDEAVAPYRAAATPIVDMIQSQRYADIFPPEEQFPPFAMGHTMFLDTVGGDVAEAALDRVKSSTALISMAQFRVLGGAIARVADDATPYAHRQRRIITTLGAFFTDPGQFDTHAAWIQEFAGTISQQVPGAYVNFLGPEGPERVRAAYPDPATWDRLRTIKSLYDPGNLFQVNQNIPPSP